MIRFLLCFALFLIAPLARAGEGEKALHRWDDLRNAAYEKAEAGQLEEADVLFAKAADLARNAKLDGRCEEESLYGRIRCLEVLGDLVTVRFVSAQLLVVQQALLEAGVPSMVEDVPRDVGLADTWMDLGFLETYLGDLRTAVDHLHRALRAATDAESEPHVAAALARLANAELQRGRIGPARAAAEAAESIFRTRGEKQSLVEVLLVLARLHWTRGDEVRARACHDEAARLVDDLPDVPAALAANLLAERASLYLESGALELALDAARRSREIALAGNDAHGAALAQHEIARITLEQGQAARALELLADPVLERAAGPLVASIVALERGRALTQLGRGDEGLAEFERSVALAGEQGSLTQACWCLEALAAARLEAAGPVPAGRDVLLALDRLDASAVRLTPLGEREVRHGHDSLFRLAARIALRQPEPAETYAILERARASVLVQRLGGPDGMTEFASTSMQKQVRAARDQLVLTRDALRAARVGGSLKAERTTKKAYESAQVAYAEVLEQARRSTLLAVRELPTDEPEAGGSQRTDLEALQQRLGPHEAYVAYASDGAKLHALVVTSERAALREVGADAAVEGNAAHLRAELDRVQALRLAGERPQAQVPEPDRLEALRKQLIGSLALPKTTRRIIVSPSSGLASLPFSLLVDLERDVVVVPSGTVYERLSERKSMRGEGVLALGDPTYTPFPEDPLAGQLAAVRSPRGATDLTPLEHTRAEVEAITREGDTALLAGAASEDGLLGHLSKKRWRSLHLACHGLLDPVHPEWSALALTPSKQADGFLTVLEVLGLNVRADAVVLSACETGLGAELSGDGLLGLSTAFLSAGAPRVVASLWPVDDKATSVLMKRFYELWNPEQGDGIGAAAALRRAQEYVRTTEEGRWAHPFYWAGWVLWGLPD